MKIINPSRILEEILLEEKIQTHQKFCCCTWFYTCFVYQAKKSNPSIDKKIAYLCSLNIFPLEIKGKIVKTLNLSIYEEEVNLRTLFLEQQLEREVLDFYHCSCDHCLLCNEFY